MSTYLYLRCLDHEPPLVCESKSGSSLSWMEEIAMDYANRAEIVAGLKAGLEPPEDQYRAATALFFREHPTCRLDVLDEYGKAHEIKEPTASNESR